MEQDSLPSSPAQTDPVVELPADTASTADAIRAAMANGDEVIGMEYGRLAVSLLVKAQPDVLVLEVTEPHLMGLHLCRALRTNRAFDRVAIVACSVKAEPRNIKAADNTAPTGFALPVPTSGGAEPCTGSNIDVRPGWRFAEAATPRPPWSPAPRSVRMSPNRLLATMTSKASGVFTSCMANASTNMCEASMPG